MEKKVENEVVMGIGLGSTSYKNNIRRVNNRNLSKYLKGIYLEEENYEDKELRMENEVMLGLRKLDGIDLTNFQNKYGIPLEEKYNLTNLLKEGYLIKEKNKIKINKEYIYVSNEILLNIID